MQDFDLHEQDPRSSFHEAARRLTRACMADARGLVTVNADHVLAALIRYCWWCAFPKRLLRHRAFLCAREIPKVHQGPLHQDFLTTLRDGLHDEPNPAWDDFLGLCEREGVLQNEGCAYRRNATVRHSRAGSRRRVQTATVIADEIEALPAVIKAIKRVTRTPGFLVLRRVRAALLEEDRRLFEKDYREFYEEGVTKGPEVGRPFLLKPFRVKAGVVLVHGYMAAPLEVRAMAEYLCAKGYAVYGVRMKGHGTSPADLAGTTWEDWYASINRGYAIIRTMTERVILGGFSMGAGLALLAAGRKAGSVRAVFAINAPLHLRSTAARLAPSMVRVTSLLKRFHWGRDEWEYVENEPENRHINYTRNPVRGVAELGEAMNVMAATLGDITAPALVIQGSRDPVVHPDSGPAIFDKIGTPRKELVVLERENHGIINGRGAMDVFDRVTAFLCRADRVAYAGPSNQRSNT
jgi:esterase/lipase